MQATASATAPLPNGELVWSRQSILFSACNEDSRSELRAFGSLAGHNVFSVTAGGGRVLALLLDGPASITAVDLNPAQNALLELKVGAMRLLDHEGYLRFLGVRPAYDRLATYDQVRKSLSPAGARFFDRNRRSIEVGILFQGKLERYLALVSKMTKVVHPFGLGKLLASRTLEEQRALIDRWETPLWRTLSRPFCRRSVLAALSGDPGFYQHLPEGFVLHDAIYDRVFRHLRNNLLRENPLLQLVLHGRYMWDPALPIYLNQATYGRVKAALEKVDLRIVTGTVDEALTGSPGTYDAFSLSDICSYLTEEQHHALFERVLSRASAGARVCSRSNLYHRPLAPDHERRLARDEALEAELSLHDHSCVHDFVVGTVTRS
jgi:S-adenosylmethionine-diacylglycerol 3-amino-3-carboxypropyl transferase